MRVRITVTNKELQDALSLCPRNARSYVLQSLAVLGLRTEEGRALITSMAALLNQNVPENALSSNDSKEPETSASLDDAFSDFFEE